MYRYLKDSELVGYTNKPIFVKKKEDIFIPAEQQDAKYIVYKDTIYNILGASNDENYETVSVLEMDDGLNLLDAENGITELLIKSLS